MVTESVCPQDKIIFDIERGEYICTETGEVLEDKVVDAGPEWRAYDRQQFEEKARAKAINPNIFVNSGFLPTTAIKPKKMKKVPIYSDDKRNLVHALKFLSSAVEKLNASEIIKQEAGRILKKIWGKRHLRYLGSELIVFISIYIAYRKLRILMPFDEYIEKIWQIYKVIPKRFTSAYFEVLKNFDEKIPNFTVEDFIKGCGVRLELPTELIEKALNFAKEIEEAHILSGKSPKIVGVTILYFIAKQDQYPITQADAGKKCGVTDMSVRRNVGIIRKYLVEKESLKM